jgi:hypothetical protein
LFKKTAFKRPEHEKIAKGILRDRFDEDLFLQVHQYIDLSHDQGRNHRQKHGHDSAAEKEIEARWGAEGVEHFKIHILADWIYDNLAQVVEEYYDKHNTGEFLLPYYGGTEVPYCVAQKLREDAIPANPLAVATELKDTCKNCGSSEDLTLSRFWAGMICAKCLDERQIEVCLDCSAVFYSGLRVESNTNPGKYLCPWCSAAETKG